MSKSVPLMDSGGVTLKKEMTQGLFLKKQREREEKRTTALTEKSEFIC